MNTIKSNCKIKTENFLKKLLQDSLEQLCTDMARKLKCGPPNQIELAYF